ncbi:hypothetical protein [Streptomyces nodosus]|uniref:hypothetical protein n=1 Tax=Streptomyces nodosus TaxID=40318 RepID=UPI003F50E617
MPHASRLLAGTLIGRLPTGMAPLAIVLISAPDSGYGLAGGLAALYLLANALGGPLLGRMVDRCGQTQVPRQQCRVLGPPRPWACHPAYARGCGALTTTAAIVVKSSG